MEPSKSASPAFHRRSDARRDVALARPCHSMNYSKFPSTKPAAEQAFWDFASSILMAAVPPRSLIVNHVPAGSSGILLYPIPVFTGLPGDFKLDRSQDGSLRCEERLVPHVT